MKLIFNLASLCLLSVLPNIRLQAQEAHEQRIADTSLQAQAADQSRTSKAAQTGIIYYVSTTGSDSNPGTSNFPFLTIQHAANVVSPGDTVIVKNGTYSCASCSGFGKTLVSPTRSGTADKYITFRAQNKWGAVLDGLHNTTGEAFEISANYIRIQGFEIKGFSQLGISNYRGGQFIQVVQNNIHDIGRYCSDSTAGREALFMARSATIEQNLVHDIGRYAPGEGGCKPATPYYKNHDHGIYVAGAVGLTVKNNVFYNLLRGWSIHFYGSTGTSNVTIVNNAFGFPNPYVHGHFIVYENLSNATIENNIFYQPSGSVAMRIQNNFPYSNVVIRNNLVYRGTSYEINDSNGNIVPGIPRGVSISNETDNTDPRIVSASTTSPNFHLTSGSAAINTGLTISGVTNDYAGTVRPQGGKYDIGAYEFVGP